MDQHFVGMHFLWWAFWLVLIIPVFTFATPIRRKTARLYRENPFGILQRRYAAGEISTEDYEERKSRIERDAHQSKPKPLSSVSRVQDVPA